jgi:hypothetical protein
MPAYLVYVLIILALSTAAGVGFKAGTGLVQMFTAIGFGVVIIAVAKKTGNTRLKRWVSKSKCYYVFSESGRDSEVFCPY